MIPLRGRVINIKQQNASLHFNDHDRRIWIQPIALLKNKLDKKIIIITGNHSHSYEVRILVMLSKFSFTFPSFKYRIPEIKEKRNNSCW